MSNVAVKEQARRCDRCGRQWFAVRVAKPSKPRWYDEQSILTDAQARMARLQGNASRQQVAYDQWSKCPSCGSISVQTISASDFRGAAPILPSFDAPPPPPASNSTPGTRSCGCGMSLPRDAKFCSNCGTPAAQASAPMCPCGRELQQDTKFCPNCGAAAPSFRNRVPLQAPPVNEPQPIVPPQQPQRPARDRTPAQLHRHLLAEAKKRGDRDEMKRLKRVELERLSKMSLWEKLRESWDEPL
jgi:ribosomal protein S27AE